MVKSDFSSDESKTECNNFMYLHGFWQNMAEKKLAKRAQKDTSVSSNQCTAFVCIYS